MVAFKDAPKWVNARHEFSALYFAENKQELIQKYKDYDLTFIGEPEPIELMGHVGYWFKFTGVAK